MNHSSTWPVGPNSLMEKQVPSTAQLASGLLLFFDEGRTILLGKEFRKRDSTYSWMEFGGKVEGTESPAETACREANEETAETLNISVQQVQQAEQDGHFIDYYNDKTNFFYRMYCVRLKKKPSTEEFSKNAVGKSNVEKIEWCYFPSRDIIYNQDGSLPGTDVKLYSTMCTRIGILREKEFLQSL